MAKQIIYRLTDDIDGSEAAETVTFALDGMKYEIDLSEAHSKELRAALMPYIHAGTRLGRWDTSRPDAGRSERLPRGAAAAVSAANRDENRAIRHWATNNGFPRLSDRGRIPQDVVNAFRNRQTPAAKTPQAAPAETAAAPAKNAATPPEQPKPGKAGSSPKKSAAPRKSATPVAFQSEKVNA